MDMLETWKAFIPALVASVSVLVLAAQLRQQNRLERKRIEADYVKRALELLDQPLQVLMRINAQCRLLHHRMTRDPTSDIDLDVIKLHDEWETVSDKYLAGIAVAINFARQNDRQELATDLDAALSATIDLRETAARVIAQLASSDGELMDWTLHEDPLVQAAAVTRGKAARSLVKRIHELYG